MTAPARQTLTVEWMGPSLNKVYAGVHWRERTTWADFGHIAVMAAVKQAGVKPVKAPVRLIFTPHVKGRKYDTLNYAFTAKIFEDGLVREHILKDDTAKYVLGVTINAPVKTKEQSYMVVVIEEAR